MGALLISYGLNFSPRLVFISTSEFFTNISFPGILVWLSLYVSNLTLMVLFSLQFDSPCCPLFFVFFFLQELCLPLHSLLSWLLIFFIDYCFLDYYIPTSYISWSLGSFHYTCDPSLSSHFLYPPPSNNVHFNIFLTYHHASSMCMCFPRSNLLQQNGPSREFMYLPLS